MHFVAGDHAVAFVSRTRLTTASGTKDTFSYDCNNIYICFRYDGCKQIARAEHEADECVDEASLACDAEHDRGADEAKTCREPPCRGRRVGVHRQRQEEAHFEIDIARALLWEVRPGGCGCDGLPTVGEHLMVEVEDRHGVVVEREDNDAPLGP